MSHTMKRLTTGAMLVVPMLLLAACGDDDEAAETTTTETTTTEAVSDDADESTTEEVGAGDDVFCDAFVDLQTAVNAMGGPDGDPAALEAAMDQVETNSPDELADATSTMATEGRAAGDDMPSDAFFEAQTEVSQWTGDNCGFETLTIEGGDYFFDGIPEDVAAGPTVINFDNRGDELHEFALVRINDGVTATVEELLSMSEEESAEHISFVGAVFAEPGATSTTVADLAPGRYAAVCFVPVGSTPEAVADAESHGTHIGGPPHVMNGMVAEFTVS